MAGEGASEVWTRGVGVHALDIGHLVGVMHRLLRCQIAFMPPSITSSVPVTKRDSSEIR